MSENAEHSHKSSDIPIAFAIFVLVLIYAGLVATGSLDEFGHHGSESHATADSHVDEHGEESDSKDDNSSQNSEHDDHPATDAHTSSTAESDGHAHDDEHSHSTHATPSVFAVIPFVLLLGAIAILPLIRFTAHWWESNKNRLLLAVVLAAITLCYFFFSFGMDKVISVLEHAILLEYVPFIVLLFSLYAISGGIRIQGDVAAHPFTNCVFLAIGGGLASFIGTTGAAMLLIRPLIDTNNERKHVQHTVVFFIFIVCNCGGCLLPIGDPPLFLGYLKGVPFLWTLWNLWAPWLFVNAALIAIYFVIDHFIYYPKETLTDIRRDDKMIRPIQVMGLWPNAVLLVGVILGVALLDPNKPLINGWHPWPFLREAVQLSMVALSLLFGSKQLRVANKFNYHAIQEVAALFIGIFICMQPALEILNEKGPSLPVSNSKSFFWATGGLSSLLDNAPTYVVFYETAQAKHATSSESPFTDAVLTAGEQQNRLIGISLGAVFLGAMTYIGNGPNFMVRAIAEQMRVPMPSFFGFVIRYSLPYLIPVFWICTLIFL